MNWRRLIVLLAAVAAMAGPRPALADCVSCSCSLNSSGLVFGPYNPRRPTTGSVGVIGVTCDGDNGYLINLSSGSSGTAALRTLHNGSDVLNYNLYKDVTRTIVWGDGANGFTGVSGSGTANYNVYGGIFGNQVPLVGTYIDTLVISVEY